MPRSKRRWVSQEVGSFHIISRTTLDNYFFSDEEKEHFLELLEKFASGFFVNIHAFSILGNHFHILATGQELEAENASKEELFSRYRLVYGDKVEPPIGSYKSDGCLIPDEDGGVDRLRRRLGSISRFVQELKQTYTRWYNKKHKRKGYLWGDRFKGVIVEKGEAQLACSAYIDLNPVRAFIVKRPEDYRWSSLGLRVRNPKRSTDLLTRINEPDIENSNRFPESKWFAKSMGINELSWYREFVYVSGSIEREGKGKISPELVNDVRRCHGKLGIGDSFAFRVKNISEGVAIGSFNFISDIQEKYNRKFIRPRIFLSGNLLFATRVLRL